MRERADAHLHQVALVAERLVLQRWMRFLKEQVSQRKAVASLFGVSLLGGNDTYVYPTMAAYVAALGEARSVEFRVRREAADHDGAAAAGPAGRRPSGPRRIASPRAAARRCVPAVATEPTAASSVDDAPPSGVEAFGYRQELKRSLLNEPDNTVAWRLLAQAYDKQKKDGEARVAAAIKDPSLALPLIEAISLS